MKTSELLRIAGETALTYPPRHGFCWGRDERGSWEVGCADVIAARERGAELALG
jgi:hypothetical protein